MNILILTSTYPRGENDSIPGFVADLTQELSKKHKTVVLAPAYPNYPRHQTDGNIEIFRFRYAPFPTLEKLAYGGGMLANIRQHPWLWIILPFYLASLFCHLLWAVKQYKIEVIHVHWLIPQGVVVACATPFLRRIPLVMTCHGGDIYSFNGILGKAIKKFSAKYFSSIIAVSNQMATDIRQFYNDKFSPLVIPMSVATSIFINASLSAKRNNRFLFVGRLIEKKGVMDLIEALNIAINRRGHSLFVDIIGEGPLHDLLEARTRQYTLSKNIQFLGWKPRNEVALFMANAQALIMPSTTGDRGDREGLGLVAVESICARTPVIAYDFGCIRDIVQHEKNGILVPEGNTEYLAKTLIEFNGIQSPIEISEQEQEETARRFSPESIAQKYDKIYCDLLKQ